MIGSEGPGVANPVAHVAWQLREQGRICSFMASPLYGALLEQAGADALRQGPTWRILQRHLAPGRGNATALRFMAAVHRLVLTGRAPALAAHYPDVGGDGDVEAANVAFVAVVEGHVDVLAELAALPCQTNEVGRSAALIFGLLDAASRHPLPVRLLEVGSSAGLNLRLDHFRYGGGGSTFGPNGSPVELTGLWVDGPLRTDVSLRVVSRNGCDPHPLDPTRDEDRLALKASLWADQIPRFARLEGALALAANVPAHVERSSADRWLDVQLNTPAEGTLRVVFHSIVYEYFDESTRIGFHQALDEAGARATEGAPLAWVRLEPMSDIREHALTITLWPGGETRILATCGAHGMNVRRARGGVNDKGTIDVP
jgi:hypothetical protein